MPIQYSRSVKHTQALGYRSALPGVGGERGRGGEREIRFRERSLIEGSQSMASQGLRETRE